MGVSDFVVHSCADIVGVGRNRDLKVEKGERMVGDGESEFDGSVKV